MIDKLDEILRMVRRHEMGTFEARVRVLTLFDNHVKEYNPNKVKCTKCNDRYWIYNEEGERIKGCSCHFN